MGERSLITSVTRKYLYEGNYMGALLRTSADLEYLFFMKLFFEKKIKYKVLKNWTLSKYLDWVLVHDLIDKKQEKLLRDFNKLRNLIIHTRVSLPHLNQDLKKLNFLTKMISKVCDFIDNTSVKYIHNQELENEYSKIDDDFTKRYNKISERNKK